MFDDPHPYDATDDYDHRNVHFHDVQLQQNAARRDPRPIADRPKIPQEIWDKLDLAAKVWYCGRDKEDIDKIVANQTRQQSAQQAIVQTSELEHHIPQGHEMTLPTPGYTRDQLVHLQNIQEIDRLMTSMGSNTSQAARTDTS